MRVKQLDRRQRAADSIGSQMAPRADERTEPGAERCPDRLREITGRCVQPIGEADGDQGSSRWRIGGSRFAQYAQLQTGPSASPFNINQGPRIGGAGASKYRQVASRDAPDGGFSPRSLAAVAMTKASPARRSPDPNTMLVPSTRCAGVPKRIVPAGKAAAS